MATNTNATWLTTTMIVEMVELNPIYFGEWWRNSKIPWTVSPFYDHQHLIIEFWKISLECESALQWARIWYTHTHMPNNCGTYKIVSNNCHVLWVSADCATNVEMHNSIAYRQTTHEWCSHQLHIWLYRFHLTFSNLPTNRTGFHSIKCILFVCFAIRKANACWRILSNLTSMRYLKDKMKARRSETNNNKIWNVYLFFLHVFIMPLSILTVFFCTTYPFGAVYCACGGKSALYAYFFPFSLSDSLKLFRCVSCVPFWLLFHLPLFL